MTCYLCERELNDSNRTKEHIIPGALGNNLISESILCGECNNGSASRIDAALVKSLSHLYSLLQEARPSTNKKNKLIGLTESGEEIQFTAGMVPYTQIAIKLPDGTVHEMSCPAGEEISKIRKRLRELKGKFPEIDIDEYISNIQNEYKPIDELVYFSNHDTKHSIVGGPDFFRGIKKIAINYYLSRGYDRKYINGIIYQVKYGKPGNEVLSKFYYPSIRPVHQTSEKEVSHIIKLVGNPEMGVLYCYVELFNCNHALILLNNHYEGPPLDEQFCYDVLTSTHIHKEISLPVKHREHIVDFFKLSTDTNAAGDAAYRRTRRILEEEIRQKGQIK
jgi:hypothetical protein